MLFVVVVSNMAVIYTIGHSNNSLENFIALLKKNGVDCVVDIRSVPASSHTPQFNQNSIKPFLKSYGVQYLHLGKEFGARRTDALIDGQVNFEKAVRTQAFLNGIKRLKTGIFKGYTISLMCTEADPLACHRFSLVSKYLFDNGFDVRHILKDGTIKKHLDLEREMINIYLNKRPAKLPEIDEMFGTYTAVEQRDDAYRLKNKEIGYKPNEQYNQEEQL